MRGGRSSAPALAGVRDDPAAFAPRDAAFDLAPARAREILAAVPGCGPWTVEMTMGLALGDPDAVPIGDLRLPSIVT